MICIDEWLRTTVIALGDISASPQREAQWLLESVTGLDRRHQLLEPHQLLSEEEVAELETRCQRRLAGVPLAYVIGEAAFWTLTLAVSPAVLIPRSDTEILVDHALRYIPNNSPMSVADLGTGSGAIALALASERPHSRVLACDISPEALSIAASNRKRIGAPNVSLLQSDWFAALHSSTGPLQFDLIVSNPPYIEAGDPALEDSVSAYEPALALFAPDGGLAAIRHLVEQSAIHLYPGGRLLLEHGWQQAASVQELLESRGFIGVASHPDLGGHLRVTEGQRPSVQ